MSNTLSPDDNNGIFAVWLSWIISSGAMLLVLLVPLFIRPIWTPVVAVALEIGIWAAIRRGREGSTPRCLLSLFITSRILFWSAMVMLAVLLFHRQLLPTDMEAFGINREIPFIPVLIMAPIGVAVCSWMLIRGHDFPFCVDCKLRFGTPAERGFLGILYSQEGTTQVKVLLYGFILQALAAIPYYIFKYVNESLTPADTYFFFGIPAALWVLGTLYITLRYIGIWRYYDQDIEGSQLRHGTSTRLRFLIVGDNRLLVSLPEDISDDIPDLQHPKADTPAKLTLPFRERMPEHEAQTYLEGITKLKKPKIRFLYTTSEWDIDCNVFHYIVNVDEKEMTHLNHTIRGAAWLTLRDYNVLLAQNALESMLSAEIYRIYTSAMAFKTYNTKGKRLYPIKHYHPTFRLNEIIDYKVDYNDRHWLYVAHCNEDQMLYRLRSFWRRYISGLSY
ncbi:MAG: hypothetical protein NC342_05145 [Pseudoflavonifractor sp.]|nr:hypothetical protein [Alloprevotella sp.]MCM1116905.1 hypothetical protein [Pseudoflavonifractor sp.]